MGIVQRLLTGGERRGWNLSLAELDAMMDTQIGGASAVTGRAVTPESAMELSAFYAGIRLLSRVLASVPLIVYRRLPNRGRDFALDHSLYWMLHDEPNPEMTPFEFRVAQLVSYNAWGRSFAEIQRNLYTGDATALWPLRPDRMKMDRIGGELVYIYRLSDGTDKIFARNLILHCRDMTTDGITAMVPTDKGREAIGLGLATEEFGARFFGNGAQPGAVLQHPGTLGDEAYKRITKSWETRHQGLSNAQRIAILEEGMTLETIGVDPDKAQFLETRKFQIREISRFLGVPPHKIGDLDQATFSNIEHQAIEFVTDTVRPTATSIEQRYAASLLSRNERKEYFIEHKLEALIRGDLESQSKAWSTGRQGGWLSRNEIRAWMNLNPVEGGDDYLTPMNMTILGEEPAAPEADDTDTEARALPRETATDTAHQLRTANSRRRLANSYRRTIEHVAQRVVNREVNDVRNAARRYLGAGVVNVPGFEDWLRDFDPPHRKFVREYLDPPLRTYTDIIATDVEREIKRDVPDDEVAKFAADYITGRTNQWMANLMRAMRKAVTRPVDMPAGMETWNPLDAVEEELDDRAAKQAGSFAEEESFRTSNAVALAMYVLAGVTLKVWQAAGGDNCPYCSELNGQTIGVDKLFLPAGTALAGAVAGATPFVSQADIGHPPIHAGCSCVIVAG